MGLFSLQKPTEAATRSFLELQRELPFAYPAIGATSNDADLPAGYAVDRVSIVLGSGREAFAAARRRCCVG